MNYEKYLKSIIKIALKKEKSAKDLMIEIAEVVKNYEIASKKTTKDAQVSIPFARQQFFHEKARNEYLRNENMTLAKFETLSDLEKELAKEKIKIIYNSLVSESVNKRKNIPSTFEQHGDKELTDDEYEKIKENWKQEQLKEIDLKIKINADKLEKLKNPNNNEDSSLIIEGNLEIINLIEQDNRSLLLEKQKYI